MASISYVSDRLPFKGFQKSKVFLYPALEIRRGASVLPVMTYTSWREAGIKTSDRRLIGVYNVGEVNILDPSDVTKSRKIKVRNMDIYKNFEKIKLTGNKLFDKIIEIEPDVSGQERLAYLFDFNKDLTIDKIVRGVKVQERVNYSRSWDFFHDSRYTKMSPDIKRKIVEFFRYSENYGWVESWIYPEKYYAIYAQLLDVNMDVLKETTELCERLDFSKERLVEALPKKIETLIKKQ